MAIRVTKNVRERNIICLHGRIHSNASLVLIRFVPLFLSLSLSLSLYVSALPITNKHTHQHS